MATASSDPVPAIAEADATGEIAELYGDIRATLGVPVVNLIWRHLAVFPGGLEWAWACVKPMYVGGSVTAQAAALRAGLKVPALAGLSEASLAAAGLSADDLDQITMILGSYERSNAMNMVALAALLARLEGGPESGIDMAAADNDAAVDGEMPELLTLDAMAPPVRTLVEDLNKIGGRDEILASMYRHLAHWPAYLALVHAVIAPFAADGKLEPVIRGVIADGRRRGGSMTKGLGEPKTGLDAGVMVDLQASVAQFVDGPIGKMIAIVPLIRGAMP